jgi:hypothetical protein
MTDWHRKPPASVRSVEQAMDRAERQKKDLSLVVQVHDYDWDLVILADEIKRLRKAQE